MLAAFWAACWAANGVPFRDPRKPSEPELFQARTLPAWAAIVTIVLLNEAWMWAMPCGTCFRSFFLNVFFLPFFSAAAAPVPAAAATGFAIVGRSSLVVRGSPLNRWNSANGQRLIYVFAVAFFFCATVPLRGPFRV